MTNTSAGQDNKALLAERDATIQESVNDILSSYDGREDELIPILQRVQQDFGYLPEIAMKRLDIKKFPYNFLILAAILLLIPLIIMQGGTYGMHVLILVLINSILSVSLNLFIGYTGQINLAHISFFGIGSYALSNLVMKAGMDFWPALFLGGLISAGIAAAV